MAHRTGQRIMTFLQIVKANQEQGSTHRYYILVSNHSKLVWKMVFSYYLSVCQKENKLFLKEYKAFHNLLLFSYMVFIICSEIVRYAMLPTKCLQQTCKIFVIPYKMHKMSKAPHKLFLLNFIPYTVGNQFKKLK